jgi:hypothetical protein
MVLFTMEYLPTSVLFSDSNFPTMVNPTQVLGACNLFPVAFHVFSPIVDSRFADNSDWRNIQQDSSELPTFGAIAQVNPTAVQW